MTEMLPFETKIQIPLSAICSASTSQSFLGHRVTVKTNKRTKKTREYCKLCMQALVHDRDIGCYVTPFIIEEEPELW